MVAVRQVFPGPPPKVAVADLCLSVRAGERFGLLGNNGGAQPKYVFSSSRRFKQDSDPACARHCCVDGVAVRIYRPHEGC